MKKFDGLAEGCKPPYRIYAANHDVSVAPSHLLQGHKQAMVALARAVDHNANETGKSPGESSNPKDNPKQQLFTTTEICSKVRVRVCHLFPYLSIPKHIHHNGLCDKNCEQMLITNDKHQEPATPCGNSNNKNKNKKEKQELKFRTYWSNDELHT